MTEFRNRETHAVSLASGRSLAPGESGEITNDPHDQGLLKQGSLVEVDETVDYDAQSVEALQNLADSRGLKVKGTGTDGRVVKADLIKAHTAADQKKEA